MKSVKFLQQARGLADYIIQASNEVAASLPQPETGIQRDAIQGRLNKIAAGEWDGLDRRAHQERRASDRRNEPRSVMLDTRVRTDRRRDCRRRTDELALRSFSCRV